MVIGGAFNVQSFGGTMKEIKDSNKREEKGMTPEVSGGKEALTTEERSLDIGESGQFAPGGYYNQQRVNEPKRRRIDDDIVPPARR
jgi:hypothetical protein